MPVPDFSPGEVLTAQAMDSVAMWLVKTQTVGTTVASVTVEDAFSSTYDNYKISYTGGQGSTSHGLALQLGIGATMTASAYFGGIIFINVGANAVQHVTYNGTASAGDLGGGGATYSTMTAEILQPNFAKNTFISGGFQLIDFGRVGSHAYTQNSTTQFTSFRITPSAGTLTGGTIRVYGFRN